MIQRYSKGAWQEIKKLEKSVGGGVFADCEFARREQAGAWVDVWKDRVILKAGESFHMDRSYIQVNDGSLSFRGASNEDYDTWRIFGTEFASSIPINAEYDVTIRGSNYDYNNTWKYSSHLVLLRSAYESNGFSQVEYYQASVQNYQRHYTANTTGTCFGLQIGTRAGVHRAWIEITISNVILNGKRYKFEL